MKFLVSLFRNLYLKIKPISAGDSFYGHTKDLVKDPSVKELSRFITISVMESKKNKIKVLYRYYGTGGNLVTGSKLMKRAHLNNHYVSGRINHLSNNTRA